MRSAAAACMPAGYSWKPCVVRGYPRGVDGYPWFHWTRMASSNTTQTSSGPHCDSWNREGREAISRYVSRSAAVPTSTSPPAAVAARTSWTRRRARRGVRIDAPHRAAAAAPDADIAAIE